MRILVTGATGFLGGHVAQHLHALGYQVTATGRNQTKGSALGVPFRAAELDDSEQAFLLCQDQDVVVHCAGLSSPWGGVEDFERHNQVATSHLLNAKVARFVYISSAGVYFRGDERIKVREDSPLPESGQHPYIQSKRRCEELVQKSQNWVILRPRAIYGPGDTAILPRVLRLMKPGLLPIIGRGQNVASLTYVHNLVQAVELALKGPTKRIFNITDPQPVELWPLLHRLAQRLDMPPLRWRLPLGLAQFSAHLIQWIYDRLCPHKEPPITPYTLSLLTKSQTLDIRAAQRDLNYQPLYSTDEAVLATLQALAA